MVSLNKNKKDKKFWLTLIVILKLIVSFVNVKNKQFRRALAATADRLRLTTIDRDGTRTRQSVEQFNIDYFLQGYC